MLENTDTINKSRICVFFYTANQPFRISASYSINSENSPFPNIDRRKL